MGKGDIKSKKGKISNGSFGNSRKRRSASNNSVKSTTEVTANQTTTAKAPAATK